MLRVSRQIWEEIHDAPTDGQDLIVVENLEAAKAFFVELGMQLEGEMPIEGVGWIRSLGFRTFEPN